MIEEESMEILNTVSDFEKKKIISEDGQSYRIEMDPQHIELSYDDIQRLLPDSIAKILFEMDPQQFTQRAYLDEKKMRDLFQNGESKEPSFLELNEKIQNCSEPFERDPNFTKRVRDN